MIQFIALLIFPYPTISGLLFQLDFHKLSYVFIESVPFDVGFDVSDVRRPLLYGFGTCFLAVF